MYLLVAHNGISRAIESYVRDMSNEEFAGFGIKNCELRKYEFWLSELCDDLICSNCQSTALWEWNEKSLFVTLVAACWILALPARIQHLFRGHNKDYFILWGCLWQLNNSQNFIYFVIQCFKINTSNEKAGLWWVCYGYFEEIKLQGEFRWIQIIFRK